MCGITGFINFSSQPEKEILENSLNQIIYRGPDSWGEYIDKNVALGIRRLSIIDLSTGDQPISNENGMVTVVFNGEIYNFLELRKKLIKEKHKFKTNADTEVLVHLYEKYGEDMPKFLNGMFAFAIWDKPNQKLFIARDHAGIKPLYYWTAGDKLIFGSELKTIIDNPLVKKNMNQDSLLLYTYFGYIPGEQTIFKNIYKLLPGHSLTFSKKGLDCKQYYQITKSHTTEQSLDELFADTIKLQSVADVPLGVFLSGGLDSSLVTYYLTQISSKVKTFSISFSEKSFDESNFAFEVAKLLGTEHKSDIFAPRDVIKLFPRITKLLDEPLADPSLFPTFKVCEFARKYVKVVLSGDGGDELFGGYPTYQGHLIAQKMNFAPKFLTSKLHLFLKLLPESYENYPKKDILTSFLNGIHKSPIARQLFWMSLFSLSPDKFELLLNKPVLENEIIELLNKGSNNQSFEKIENMELENSHKMQLVDFNTYLADDLLTKVDRASMFNSLEVRVPFLDPRLINFAFAKNLKHIDFFETKKLLRKLLKNKLPKSIIGRKKKGFGIPIAKWIRTDLRDFVKNHLENKKLNGFYNREVISTLWDNHQSGKENNSKIIWMLVIFSGWLNSWGKQ